jgi:hypothetical protein
MTKTLEFEHAESVDSNGVHGGIFDMVIFGDFGTLRLTAEIEHEFDEWDIFTRATVLQVEQADDNDEPTSLTFTNKEIEDFIESDSEVAEFFQDRISTNFS